MLLSMADVVVNEALENLTHGKSENGEDFDNIM